ncbi:MAG: dihydroorotate dehydrogenase electron transfer subunit [Candidatus Marinimicrobia bacterium]|nr:dihydroorotate dehydrogenase electron transfer subunit [Candidatus Neomarinimicrobiota bacterium]
MKTFPVIDIKHHSAEIKSIYFKQIEPDIYPGQFFNVWLPGVDEKPFSISDVFQGIMEITVKAVGPFTRALVAVERGDFIGLRGPFGTHFTFHHHALLVGGGMGIVPLRYLARMLRQQGFHFEILLGARCEKEIPFQNDFSEWAPTTFVTEDGSLGYQGQVTEYIHEKIRESKLSFIYSAGPEAMLIRVMEEAKKAGLNYEISFERYMKCGIGICGQCVVNGSGIRLCKEGPVLSRNMAETVTEWGIPHRDATGKRKV